MIDISAANPVWSNAEKTTIDLMVKFPHFSEPVPFTASPNDPEQHGRDIYELAAAGKFGEIGEFSAA